MLTVKEIVKATKGKLINGEDKIIPKKYEFDSREVKHNSFFIPLEGENTDGHKYIIECLEKGSIGFLIKKDLKEKKEIIKQAKDKNPNVVIIEVEDTQKALFAMGQKNREKHKDIPIVAITGSVGKTSTREMIANVLEIKYSVLKTIKNYNSSFGIPFMLLMLDKQDIFVMEVGIDRIGEMKEITSIATPDVAVITNIGLSHIENFGKIETTYIEKTNICNSLSKDGVCVANGDDELLANIGNTYNGNIRLYGIKNDDEYIVDNVEYFEDKITFNISSKEDNEQVTINDIGNHNILNALAAIKVGKIFNMKIEQIIHGISRYKNFERRMKQEKLKNNSIVINDAYNSSYTSLISGLETIESIPAKKRIIVLGDILELGDYSSEIHSKIGSRIKEFNIDVVITYGKASKHIYDEIRDTMVNKYMAKSKEEILDIIDKELEDNTIIYIKSSNGMKLYELGDYIVEKHG